MSDKGFISPGFSSLLLLLLHFPTVQPHNVPQLLPADRHLHFVVLHSDFLLQEQHSAFALLFVTASNPDWCACPAASNSSNRLLLPTLAEEVWAEPSWWLTIFKYQKSKSYITLYPICLLFHLLFVWNE